MLKWFEKNNKFSWIITLLIASTIFYLSSLNFGKTNTQGNFPSIIYHFFAFFFLSFFLSISCIKGDFKKKHLIILVIIVSVVYGILDELHQYFTPNRFMSFYDIMINTSGIFVASLIYFIRINGKEK